MSTKRLDHRRPEDLRSIRIQPNILDYAEGSVLVEYGKTRVICSATYEDQTPKWLQGSGRGWVTAEYGMLPRSTHSRVRREKIIDGGRTHEISRLIGRSLRAGLNLNKMQEKQITIDCDVINADGGTRTASVTGGFVAMALALKKLYEVGELKEIPLKHYVAAVSIGLHEGKHLVDLNYEEDSSAGADVNFVMTDSGHFVEIQGTAEHSLFSRADLGSMSELAEAACKRLFSVQEEFVGPFFALNVRA